LDVVALVGSLRYRQHRTAAEIHEQLTARKLTLAPRSVTNLLDRYDELLALATLDPKRLHPKLLEEGRVILAIAGLQPDAGHEVLWVIRDCLSSEILLAQALLSSTQVDLEKLIRQVCTGLPVPVVAVVSDGQKTIRNAVAAVLPKVPHQLCHFHFLREAGKPIYEMDRHAKKDLKKTVRDIRVLERQVETQEGPQAEAVMGYCQAVRSALTDDGRPPLDDKGLLLHERLEKIAASIERVTQKGGYRKNASVCVV
jgi:MULE transposase domain